MLDGEPEEVGEVGGTTRVPRTPAMTDVARVAGVSHQTVSRVLNGHPSVREETADRVRAAIAELGYRQNRAARALATGRSQVLGVVSPHSTLYGPASMLAATAEAAAVAGFAVSVSSVPSVSRRTVVQAVERLLDQRVAGLLVVASVNAATEALADVLTDVPVVHLGGDEAPGPIVRVDQVAGARLATECLLAAGHRTVWHVAGPVGWSDSGGRITGWEQTLREFGRPVPPVVTAADWSAASGYEAGRQLARDPEVTAVFAANDSLALGVLRAMYEAGRPVPSEVSVVGFDDIPEAAFLVPPLTTVRPDFDAVAREGLSVLLAEVESGTVAQASRTLPPRLVRRGSVAPPA